MQQIIFFFIRKKNFFVFLLLFTFAVSLVFKENYYQQSHYINSTNLISGNLHALTGRWTQYFDLKNQNDILTEENERLHNEVLMLQEHIEEYAPVYDSITFMRKKFHVIRATVIKNSILLHKNYITINKGKKDSVSEDMGVVSSKGVVGIVENTSKRFANVQSVLNKNSLLNAEIKKSGHFGSLTWNGQKTNIVQLLDIPDIAPIQKGDTIITGGMSTISQRVFS